jgi:hypothetical protein
MFCPELLNPVPLQRLESEEDLGPLTNSNWVYQQLLDIKESQRAPAAQSKKPWPGLGTRISVLRLDGAVGQANEGMQQVRLG